MPQRRPRARPLPLFRQRRSWTCLASLGLWNSRLFGVDARSLPCAGFNCHGCPAAGFACPVGSLAFGAATRALPFFALGILLVIAITIGRWACGLLCPVGWFQDLLRRIPGPRWSLPRWTSWIKYAVLLVFVLLLPFLIGLPDRSGIAVLEEPDIRIENEEAVLHVGLRNAGSNALPVADIEWIWRDATGSEQGAGRQSFADLDLAPGERRVLPAIVLGSVPEGHALLLRSPQSRASHSPPIWSYYCSFCPVGTAEAAIPRALTGGAQRSGGWLAWAGQRWLRLSILGLVVLASWVFSRFFCRVFCPLGAMYGIFHRLTFYKIRLDKASCTSCKLCSAVCPVELDVPREVGGSECIACGDCIKACNRGGLERRWRPLPAQAPVPFMPES